MLEHQKIKKLSCSSMWVCIYAFKKLKKLSCVLIRKRYNKYQDIYQNLEKIKIKYHVQV